MKKFLSLLSAFVCVGLFVTSCDQKTPDSEADINAEIELIKAEFDADYISFLASVDSLNLAYGLNEVIYTKAMGVTFVVVAADAVGEALGCYIGGLAGSSLGWITANPVVGVAGMLIGRKVGAVVGAAGLSALAEYLLTRGKAGDLAFVIESRGYYTNDITPESIRSVSVGELHNIILDRLFSGENEYITKSGEIAREEIYDDIVKIIQEFELDDELCLDAEYRNKTLEFYNRAKLTTELSINNDDTSEMYLNRLTKDIIAEGVPEMLAVKFNAVSMKLMSTRMLERSQVESYSEDLVRIITKSNLDDELKYFISSTSSVMINSIQYWK